MAELTMRGELARRELEVDGRPIVLTVRYPEPMTEDGKVRGFSCEGVIEVPGAEPIMVPGGGVDEIQAILLCLAACEARVATLGQRITWLGMEGSGLPHISSSESGHEIVLTVAMPTGV